MNYYDYYSKKVENFDLEKILPPEWIMFPNIPFWSIWWRMWYWEEYREILYNFYEKLSDEDFKKYFEIFPVPIFWWLGLRERKLWIKWLFFPKYRNLVCVWSWKTNYNFENIKILETDFRIYKWLKFSKEFLIKFKEWAQEFISLEHYILYYKWIFFDDEKFYKKIWKIKNYEDLEKVLLDLPKNFDLKKWKSIEYFVYLNWNYFKFTQNKELLDELFYYIWKKYFLDEDDLLNNFLWFSLYEIWEYLKEIYKNYNKIDFKYLEENWIFVFDFNKNFSFKNL